MIRQPPAYVPSEIAVAAANLTQRGISVPSCSPAATSTRTITPMVFWASWRPCPSAIAAAETVWDIRNFR